ncbi:MAG: C25 family cysteine peptidase, partial [candidate division WOR-3 bacterium]|nr:C25 family cysteine peptidase [candidate division WOR-3 bacterium]
CDAQVAKILGYERNPFIEDSTWFRKGTTIVREDNPPDPYYQTDCRYIRNIWLNAGYMVTDSFLSTQGHNSTNVMNAINDGRTFVVYRGQAVSNWWSPFNNVDPNLTTNGYKLPVVISGTCATMSLSSTGYQGDRFVTAGTAQNPKGAIAYFGTTNTGSAISLYRGAVCRGFFRAIFEEKITFLGDAAKRAKFYMDSLYPNQTRYQEWNLFGDPTLCLWTTTPKRNFVSYDSVISQSATNFTVTVRTHLGAPVRDITVCVRMDTTIYAVGLTNSQGQVVLPIQPRYPGFMDVTVTGQDFIPYEGTVRIAPNNMPLLNYQYALVNDTTTGNGNGRINPNETVQLKVFVRNSGNISAQNLISVLRTNDALITITDSVKPFDSIPINATVANNGYYQFSVSQNCPHNYQLNFQLSLRDNQSNNWNLPFSLSVSAGKLVYQNNYLIDTLPGGNHNNRLGQKESALLKIQIQNSAEDLFSVSAKIRSMSDYVIITDSSASFGNVLSGANVINTNDPFAVSASPTLPKNQPINFKVLLNGLGNGFTYIDSFTFTITSEQGTTQDPSGPDLFGYWAYDNTDTASGRAPVYN